MIAVIVLALVAFALWVFAGFVRAARRWYYEMGEAGKAVRNWLDHWRSGGD